MNWLNPASVGHLVRCQLVSLGMAARLFGRLVVLTPSAAHLRELVGPLRLLGVDPHKGDRLHAALSPWFVVESTQAVQVSMRLEPADVERLAAMGPSAFHTSPEQLHGRVMESTLPGLVTASVTVTTPSGSVTSGPFASRSSCVARKASASTSRRASVSCAATAPRRLSGDQPCARAAL